MGRITHWRTWADLGLITAFVFSVLLLVPGRVYSVRSSLGLGPGFFARGLLAITLVSFVVSMLLLRVGE